MSEDQDRRTEPAVEQLELSPSAAKPSALLDRVERKLSETRSLLAEARRRLAESEEAEGFWRAIRHHLSAQHPATVMLQLKRSDTYVRALKSSGDPSARTILEIESSCREDAQRAATMFGRAFPEQLRRQDFYGSYPIDPTSRHPHYTIANAFLKVDVDDRALTVEISPRDGNPVTVGLDVDYVVTKVGEEVRRLFYREFDADAFLRTLLTAYQAVIRAEKRPESDAIPLRRASNRLAKNLNRFAADEFNVDLARAVKEGKVDIDRRRLHLDHTRNARQGMLLHGLEEGGYVGFISFKRDV